MYVHIILYINHLSTIIDSNSIIYHSFANEIHLQISATADKISELLHSMQSYTSDVKVWTTAKMLNLNENKT